jgi:hypothetical protein
VLLAFWVLAAIAITPSEKISGRVQKLHFDLIILPPLRRAQPNTAGHLLKSAA